MDKETVLLKHFETPTVVGDLNICGTNLNCTFLGHELNKRKLLVFTYKVHRVLGQQTDDARAT